jgi:hypothetical protein
LVDGNVCSSRGSKVTVDAYRTETFQTRDPLRGRAENPARLIDAVQF